MHQSPHQDAVINAAELGVERGRQTCGANRNCVARASESVNHRVRDRSKGPKAQ